MATSKPTFLEEIKVEGRLYRRCIDAVNEHETVMTTKGAVPIVQWLYFERERFEKDGIDTILKEKFTQKCCWFMLYSCVEDLERSWADFTYNKDLG